MSNIIKLKRGLSQDIDTIKLEEGELAITINDLDLYVGTSEGNKSIINERIDALVQDALDNVISQIYNNIYPVGSIYISVNSENPGLLFGGSWQKLEGGYLYGCGSALTSSSYTGTGTQYHTLSIDEMPSHTHAQNPHWHYNIYVGDANAPNKQGGEVTYVPTQGFQDLGGRGWTNYSTLETTASNQNTGGNKAHSHEVAWIGVYIWKRVS